MLLALLVAVVAVAVGVGIGLARPHAHRTLGPVRTFALVAAFATVVLELLPRAVAGGGLVALVVFAAGAALPWVVEQLGARVAGHRSAALRLEVGYLGLLVHHVGDGLGLGTFAGGPHAGHAHWDVLLAIGGHTVPVTAVVVLAYGRRASRGGAALRGGLFAVAIGMGIALTNAVPTAAFDEVEPFITAAVAGLLLHVATHDWLEDPPVSGGSRFIDLVAGAAGLILVGSAGAAHDHEHGALESSDVNGVALWLASRYAPALLAATVLGALLERSTPPKPRAGSVVTAALLGATTGGGVERGVQLAEARDDAMTPTAVAFAMGSAGIALETLAGLSTAFGPAFAATWAALSAVAIGLTARLSGGRAKPRPGHDADHADHGHAGHDHAGHDHAGHGHAAHDHADPDHADPGHAVHAEARASTATSEGKARETPKSSADAAARRRPFLESLENSFGRMGAPAILGISISAVLELGLRPGALAAISRSHVDLVILPLLALAVSLPPLAWVPPLLVLVDKGAYAPAALAAVAIAATNRPSTVAWAGLRVPARAAGWALVLAVGGALVFLRWPPSPPRELHHAPDPIGLVCAVILGLLMASGLLRRGVRPWLALGVGTASHDHGPCFEESARVTPVPPLDAPR